MIGFAHRLAGSLRKHFRNQRDYKDLQELPDYMLSDIGEPRRYQAVRKRLPY
jgi:uncharacterized protein YjiS (DUF1127 family)